MTASTWHSFQDMDLPDEGRVRAAVVDGRPVALSVRTPSELEPATARMLAATGPYLLHILQDGELV